MGQNPFSGQIPPEIGNISLLKNLVAPSCFFKGPLPDEISKLKKLAKLDLSYNPLNSPIPSSHRFLFHQAATDSSFRDNIRLVPMPDSYDLDRGLLLSVQAIQALLENKGPPVIVEIVCRKFIYEKTTEDEIESCPVCNIDLGGAPLEKIRPDHNLQDLRAKLFPLKRKKVKAPEIMSLPGKFYIVFG